MQVTNDSKHFWNYQHACLSQGLTKTKPESCMKYVQQQPFMTWLTSTVQQWHCKETEDGVHPSSDLVSYGDKERLKQPAYTRHLRGYWAVCNTPVCWLLYLPVTYLHGAQPFYWADLGIKIKPTITFWVMTTFPQSKNKTCLNWQDILQNNTTLVIRKRYKEKSTG